MNIRLSLRSLEQRIDYYLAFFILVISGTLIILNQIFLNKPIIFELSATLICVSALYILFENRINSIPDVITLKVSSNNIIKFNIIFFFLIIFANLVFHSNLYRPEVYFIIIVICCALIAVDILYTNNFCYSFWVLFKIFIIAFVLRAHLLYEYPGFYGVDPWAHMFWVRLLQEFGSISIVTGLNSGYPPLFHIETLTSLLITSLNLKDSLFFSIGFMYCFIIFFIFLFAKNLTGLKIGLLSSLFIAINQFHIAWGAWLIPTSIGILILSILLYLIHSKINIRAGEILVILLTLMLLYVHTLSPLVIFIAAFVYLIVSHLSTRLFAFNSVLTINYKIGYFLVALLGISVVSRFLYSPYSSGRTFLEWALIPFLYTIKTSVEFKEGDIATFIPSDFPLNRIGFYLIVAFTIFGVLYWLKPRIRNREKIGLISTVIVLIIFSYGPALLQVANFVPQRWIVFALITAAPICASGIYQMSAIPRTKNKKMAMFLLIIVIFTFFSINSNTVNLHTPFYGKLSEDASRDSLTESEMKAADTLLTLSDGKIDLVTDDYYGFAFQYYEMEKFGGIFAVNPEKYIENENQITVTRAYFVHHNDISDNFENNVQSNLIYNNHEVWASIQEEHAVLHNS